MSAAIATPITRRLMLKRAAQLAGLGAAGPLAMSLAAIGEAAAAEARGEEDYKALVCIFLMGGNDHGNTLVPYDPANYARYRAIRGAISHRREQLTQTLIAPRVPQVLTDDLRYAFAPQGNPEGAWWTRTPLGDWLPALSAEDTRLRQFLQAYGWSTGEVGNER